MFAGELQLQRWLNSAKQKHRANLKLTGYMLFLSDPVLVECRKEMLGIYSGAAQRLYPQKVSAGVVSAFLKMYPNDFRLNIMRAAQ
jgi:hypothetical protein